MELWRALKKVKLTAKPNSIHPRAESPMPYLFTCPHCQARTEVEDQYSGQSGECVVCGRGITLPQFAATASRARPGAANPRSGPGRRKSSPLAYAAAAAVVLLIIGAGFIGLIQVGSSTASRLRQGRVQLNSIRNLETIAKAMNAYAADHGTYPPPVLRDKNGKALHSWRVLLLPYLGEEDLYRQIDLSIAWDEGENQMVSYGEMPAAYRHPSLQSWSFQTNYYLVTGPGTLFPPGGSLSPSQVPDGRSKTILVVEAQAQGQQSLWTEPVDLDVLSVAGTINVNAGRDLGGVTDGGVCVATADGRAHFLSDATPTMTVQSLLSPAGDEPLPDDVLD